VLKVLKRAGVGKPPIKEKESETPSGMMMQAGVGRARTRQGVLGSSRIQVFNAPRPDWQLNVRSRCGCHHHIP
jgi:hypothetical protein